jgi:hypothetical protein
MIYRAAVTATKRKRKPHSGTKRNRVHSPLPNPTTSNNAIINAVNHQTQFGSIR